MISIKEDNFGIGENLRRLRKAVGLTQEQAAAQLTARGLPVSREVYSLMERNRRNIKVSELLTLKKIFKVCDVAEFFEGLSVELEEMQK